MNVIMPVLGWWLALVIIGWSAVPIAWRLFPTLPDRGMAFIRPLGLILVGYVFWLGATVGVLPNSRAGAFAAVLAVAGFALYLASRDLADLQAFLRRRRTLIVGYELLFLAGLAGWALYRAFVPNIEQAGGEKYMEMAFINAVVNSPRFPPLDPWLSGFAISYYYFGYILAGMLIHLTGVAPSVAFNLVVPMTMGMTLVGAFGLGYNLVALSDHGRRVARVMSGAFTAALLPLMGSLVGLVEVGYLRGWGPPALYQWLAIRELSPVPVCNEAATPFGAGKALAVGATSRLAGWIPSRFIWWWRGSRVIQDQCGEVIHEFPFFSFMLGDVHPHVVALPYVLTVLGLALAVLAGALDTFEGHRLWSARWLALPLFVGALGFLNTWDLPTFGFMVVVAYAFRASTRSAPVLHGQRTIAAVGALALAGLSVVAWRGAPLLLEVVRHVPPDAQPLSARFFLALALVAAGVAAGYGLWTRATSGDRAARRALDVTVFAVWLAALSVLFYLPFYIGFSSQAEGVGVVAIRSRLPQWLVHFGYLWFLAASLVVALRPSLRARPAWPALTIASVLGAIGLIAALTGAWTALLLALTVLLAVLAADHRWRGANAPPTRGAAADEAPPSVDGAPFHVVRGTGAPDAVAAPAAEPPASASESAVRGAGPPAPARAVAAVTEPGTDGAPLAFNVGRLEIASTFALLCVVVGLVLPLLTEFVFVRDLFGSRMNTVFKLYYQAWALLAIGAGYAPFAVWTRLPRRVAVLWTVPAAVLLGASLIYPVAALYTRTNGLHVDRLTLDGLAWWAQSYPDDLAAAQWLRAHTPAGSVILEAYGGAYEHNGRLSMASGRPTVLGWEGHEHQWRGTREQIDPRKADIERIYKTTDTAELAMLLDRYGVRYIVLSDAERGKFGLTDADVDRFKRLFTPVYASPSGQVLIFERWSGG
jgi:uncharacterized membrane protein